MTQKFKSLEEYLHRPGDRGLTGRNPLYYMKGGKLHYVPDDKILSVKNSFDIPEKVEKIKKFLQFRKNKHFIENRVLIFGTYNLRLQPFYADIDLRNKIIVNLPKEQAIMEVVKEFQYLVNRANNTPGVFFTDAKAGIYTEPNSKFYGNAVHWTASEIKYGKRTGKPDFNGYVGNKNLIEALLDPAEHNFSGVLLKIDVVLQYLGRYIECTCVYDILYIDEEKKLRGLTFPNVGKEEIIINSLIQDTKKQRENNKFFKVIKRIFALARYYKDYVMAQKIEPLLVSNVSKLSAIESDLKTIELLIILGKKINLNIISGELATMREKISN